MSVCAYYVYMYREKFISIKTLVDVKIEKVDSFRNGSQRKFATFSTVRTTIVL